MYIYVEAQTNVATYLMCHCSLNFYYVWWLLKEPFCVCLRSRRGSRVSKLSSSGEETFGKLHLNFLDWAPGGLVAMLVQENK